MALTSSSVAARLTEAYKGIEGFYILNRSGGLGYFSSDGQRLLKESFEDIPSDQTAAFFTALGDCARKELPDPDMELGYLLPMDGRHVWKTATFVLHDYVAKAVKDAFDRDITKGRMTLDEGDRKFQDVSTERGLHRGFEDLLNHIGSFGTRTWFPVLYFQPVDEAGADSAPPMRVLNMISLLGGTGRFSDVLARMRENLTKRGALNQNSRVEHRFTLQGEDD